MPEELDTTETDQNPAIDSLLDSIGAELPEVFEDRANISQAAQELMQNHQIQPDFFNDNTRSLIFVAISQRLALLKKQTMSPDQLLEEQRFINNAVVLLALDKSAQYSANKDLIDAEDSLSPETEKQIYERFTNKQLSEELKRAISDGLLDEVKTRMGITSDTEQPYELRVLSVGSEYSTHGMQPRITPEMNEDFNHPDWSETHTNFKLFKDYVKGLEERADAFGSAVGREGELPVAWITHVGDEQYLCMPQPFAEKLLHTDEQRSDYYDEDSQRRDFAILEHEYAHTQGALNPDGKVLYGMALEERRAEHFSGDKQGYGDIKVFFNDLGIITGFSVKDFLQSTQGKGQVEAYMQLAKTLGLQNMLELSLVAPKAYVSDQRPLQKEATSYNGGTEGLLAKIYDQMVSAGRAGEIEIRLKNAADALAGKNIDLDMWLSIRKMQSGASFMTDLIEKELRARSSANVTVSQAS